MKRPLDFLLLIPFLLASFISLMMIFSIAPNNLATQVISFIIGLALFVYFAKQDYGLYQAVGLPSYFLAIFFLLLTFFFGSSVRGSVRWLDIFGFSFQASEFAKPLLILAFPYFFSRFPPINLKNLLKNLLFLAIPIFLIYKQPDLGTTLTVMILWLTQLFVAGTKSWYLALGGAISLVLAKLSPLFLHDYQIERFQAFLDPASDPLGSGYNVIQAIIAVGSGGLLGKGLGHGTQSHLRFLPERHTDFIFASLAEELGLAGGIFVILVLSTILVRLLDHCLHSTDAHNRLILAGIFAILCFQTFVNIGMNIGLAPVTGITLPFISYGGSSVIATAICLGIASSLSRTLISTPSIEIK
ncbi:MAG: rod shape-determining protein RodA [bacterium]